ncbi:MAG: hypothetical protein FWD24_08335, partial [Treponema sp.]|nr:hypothetical protein [Treponema sp.]
MNRLRVFTTNHTNHHEIKIRYLKEFRVYSFNSWLITFLVFFFLLSFPLFAQQDVEATRRDTIQYGTETEIASLIQSLRTENADYLDDELMVLIETSKNQRILTGVFGFFGEREK